MPRLAGPANAGEKSRQSVESVRAVRGLAVRGRENGTDRTDGQNEWDWLSRMADAIPVFPDFPGLPDCESASCARLSKIRVSGVQNGEIKF